MTVLAGDIGGTKTLLQIADVAPGQYDVKYEKRYVSAEYADLTPMVTAFIAEAKTQVDFSVENACFGIAGPVKGRTANVTNLPWTLDADDMQRDTGLKNVCLVNDFQSVGYAVEVLGEGDIVTLQSGQAQAHGPRVVIGAGTGLGQGLLVWNHDHYDVVPSEGGHVGFAPVNELQIDLLRYLANEFGQVSYERVASGRGLYNLYRFLKDTGRGQESAELGAAIAAGDPSAAISQAAMAGAEPLAVQALDLFCQIYGRQTGNLALTCLATGGVYIGGGVAPRIIEKIKDGTFLAAFNDNDTMRDLLKDMPVHVVVNPNAGLIGSAVVASRM